MAVRGPAHRVRPIATVSLKLGDVQCRVVGFAGRVGSLNGEHQTAEVADIVLDAPVHVR